MLFIPPNSSIYFYSLPVDLRKGCEGLACISSTITTNPEENTFFMFLNRKRNRIKILYWSSNSFFYWFARSRTGVFAPKKTRSSWINPDQMKQILNGNFPEQLSLL